MNREEKLKLAQECREGGAFRPVPAEVLAALPVSGIETVLPANARGVKVWIFDGTEGETGRPLYINYHGGGFIKGRADRDTVYCSEMAADMKAIIWDVDYLLAPEDPFPAAVNEAYDIIRYAWEHAAEYRYDREKIFLLGHSAGSNLVCGALAQNYSNPVFRVRGIILDYMPADQRLNPFTKIRTEDLHDQRKLSRALMEYHYLELYMEPEQSVDVLASPALLDDEVLAAFPETLLITAGMDSLRDEGEAFAVRLAQAGTAVTWKRFRNSMHGFTINRNGEWQEALALHRRFLGSLLYEGE